MKDCLIVISVLVMVLVAVGNGAVLFSGASVFGKRVEMVDKPSFAADSADGADTVKVFSVEEDLWLSRDKFWHCSVSFLLVGAGYHLFNNRLGFRRPIAIGVSLGTTAGLGLGKELFDRYHEKRNFSYRDLVADGVGILLGYLVFVR